ncbi:DUF4097 family beta strand repeat-containing protein [Bacillus weihaiensis]|uniref:DUF4097 family beta strand repeat-containing protein n=1 Tax=Bacillus weihaiensis TaxID=1547283 RepID=UPI002354EE36|nr:DUF4097 family beta strand repeat-containing protein [Bacillus weihaiensis]
MKKVALTALVTFVIGIIGMFILSGTNVSLGKNIKIDERKTVLTKSVEDMVINVDIGEVRIKESESDEIDIRFHGSIPKNMKDDISFTVEEKDSLVEVKIDEREDFFSLHIPFIHSDLDTERILEIGIPKNTLKTLDVKTDIGKISIKDLDVEKMKAHSDVGEVYVLGHNGVGTFQSNVGEVKLEKMSGKIVAHTDTGEILLSILDMTEDIELSSNLGAVNVKFEKEPANIGLDLTTDIGEVSISGFEGLGDRSSGSMITQIGSGGPQLKVTTDIGEITINK